MLGASARVVEAGLNLVVDRVDLARTELEALVSTHTARGRWVLGAAIAFTTAWWLAMAALVVGLVSMGLPLGASLGAGAVVSAGAGAGLSLRARPKAASP